jgi:SAM-dependent methyltransferase
VGADDTDDLLDPDAIERRFHAAFGEHMMASDVELLRGLLPPPPARVLDVPCGHGRITDHLRAQGYTVVATDISAVGTRATRDRVGAAVAIQADMADLPVAPNQFDVALCVGNSLLFADDTRTLSFFAGVAKALAQGGRFILSGGHRDSYVRALPIEPRDHADGDLTIHHDEAFDAVTGLRTTTTEYRLPDGGSHRDVLTWKLYTMTELNTLLRSAGLKPTGWYGDPKLGPATVASASITVVAERAG